MTERQQQLVQNVEKHRQMILDAERWLWAHPQTGYTEWEAHNYLVEKYEALGLFPHPGWQYPRFLYRSGYRTPRSQAGNLR